MSSFAAASASSAARAGRWARAIAAPVPAINSRRLVVIESAPVVTGARTYHSLPLLTGRLRVHHLWLARHRRAANLLLHRRPLLALTHFQFHGPSARDRLQHPFDDAHVCEALFAGRLGLAVLQDAVREVQQFRRELIALAEFLLALTVACPQRVRETDRVFVGGFQRNAALGPRDREDRAVRRAEAARERSKPLILESQCRRDCL